MQMHATDSNLSVAQYLSLSLSELGIWLPARFLTRESAELQLMMSPDEAFGFWASVFGWKNPANDEGVKEWRLNKVATLVSKLQRHFVHSYSLGLVQVVELDRKWYHENNDVARLFFEQVQLRVKRRGAQWHCISYGSNKQRPSKAFHW